MWIIDDLLKLYELDGVSRQFRAAINETTKRRRRIRPYRKNAPIGPYQTVLHDNRFPTNGPENC
jgi:hypothetical protein